MSISRNLLADLARADVIARDIVQMKSHRRVIGVSVADVEAMAHTLCALHDAAMHSAVYLLAREEFDRVRTEAAPVETADLAALERWAAAHADLSDAHNTLALDLAGLGLVALSHSETPTTKEAHDGQN